MPQHKATITTTTSKPSYIQLITIEMIFPLIKFYSLRSALNKYEAAI